MLSVSAVLVHLMAPAMQQLIGKERRTAAVNQMLRGVQFARAAAISYGVRSVFCPSPADGPDRCGDRNDWHRGALVFLDRDADGSRDSGEQVLLRLPGWGDGSTVQWRAFRNRSYLVFQPRGLTDWQNGSFTWCPPSGHRLVPMQIILNAAGRTRRAQDTDGDGIPEDARGQPITC